MSRSREMRFCLWVLEGNKVSGGGDDAMCMRSTRPRYYPTAGTKRMTDGLEKMILPFEELAEIAEAVYS